MPDTKILEVTNLEVCVSILGVFVRVRESCVFLLVFELKYFAISLKRNIPQNGI